MAMTLNAQEQERINNVYNEREKALAENSSLYEGLINQAGELRDQQNAYLAQQEAIQNENLDKQFAYQQEIVNQQKEEAAKEKKVEENKAINDYTSYINPYGLQNERMYAAGLGNSGASETSKLGAYTAMQNRVATGAAAYQKAIQNYDNTINQAMLNRDVQKGQNALKKLQLELQNTQDYMNNVSKYSQQQFSNAQSIRDTYTNQYNTVYSQIMKEQQQAEAARQWEAEYKLAQQKAAQTNSGGGSSGGSGSLSGGGGSKTGNKNISGNTSTINGLYSANKNNTTELYQWMSPTLSGKDKDFYNNEFNKHSYATKDLLWVLDNAVRNGKLSESGAQTILSTYGKEQPKKNSSSNQNNNQYDKGFIQQTLELPGILRGLFK